MVRSRSILWCDAGGGLRLRRRARQQRAPALPGAARLPALPRASRSTSASTARRYVAYDDRNGHPPGPGAHGQPYDGGRVRRWPSARRGLFDELLRGSPFFPGAPELVRALARGAAAGDRLRRAAQEIENILDGGGLRGHFRAIVGAEDVGRDQARSRAVPARGGPAGARRARAARRGVPGLRGHHGRHRVGRAAGMKVLGVAHTYPAAKLGAAHRVVPALAGVAVGDLARSSPDVIQVLARLALLVVAVDALPLRDGPAWAKVAREEARRSRRSRRAAASWPRSRTGTVRSSWRTTRSPGARAWEGRDRAPAAAERRCVGLLRAGVTLPPPPPPRSRGPRALGRRRLPEGAGETVPCGTLREGVSRERGPRVFEASGGSKTGAVEGSSK